MLCCSTSDVARCFMIGSIFDWLTGDASNAEIVEVVRAAKFERDKVLDYVVVGRTEFSLALTATATTLQEQLGRLLV